MPELPKSGEKVYRGIPVSGGVSKGHVVILSKTTDCIPHREINECEIPAELERLEKALIQTRQQILEVQRQVEDATDKKTEKKQ